MRLDSLGWTTASRRRVWPASSGGVRELHRGERLQRHFGDRRVNEDDPVDGTASTRCTRSSTSSRRESTSQTTACRSSACARQRHRSGQGSGCMDHVQIMTEAARGKAVHLPSKGLMRLLIHVEDMADVFAASSWPRRPATISTTRAGYRSAWELQTSCGGSFPTRRSPSPRRRPRGVRHYLVDSSGWARNSGSSIRVADAVLEVINDVRPQEGLPPLTGA